ncbi:sodium- and chloride-dependent betaine transporter-like isoform X2 [Dermacentor variabilis]|uniref:sodium- and chloride-dependent betaine transporter-like isoform X2 n=1 Tax=Dermacentor variabilis TaxID=34621 RepID=UPI003F5C816D
MGSVYTAFMLLSALCAASLVQEGSFLGLLECFKPDLWKLVDIKTWHSASRHLFYSLGLSYGATTCLASYSDFQANLFEHVVKVCLLDLAYCLMGALFVFGLYGNLAHSFHIEIGDLVTQGISYTFVGFPETTSSRYLQRLWCFPFYLMVFVVTFGSETCLVGGFLGSLKDNYPALRSRPTLTALVACVAGFALAVPFTFQGGLYLIELFDGIVYGDLIPWMGIAEVLSIAYGYGCDRLRNDIYFMFEKYPPWFLPFCWRYVCPLVLAVIGVNTFMLGESREFRYQRMVPEWTGMGQLIIMAAMMVIVGSFVISTLATNKYVTQGGPSAWLEAEQERSSSSGSEYELDDEEDEEDEEGDEDEASSEGSSETLTSSTSTIPSGMLRQWRRIRKCYADNPDVIGDILVYRVLTYMGHPHWRKSSGGGCASAAGDSPNLTTVLQATMALRLEDLRQKKLQMEAAWRAMKKKAPPISRVVLEAKRRAVQQLEKELMSLHEASSKMGSGKTRRAKSEKAAAAECAQGQ